MSSSTGSTTRRPEVRRAAVITHGQAETAREIYLDATRVGRGALRLGGVRPLTSAERRFIETWEAEAYRRGIEPQADAAAGTGEA